MSAESAISRFNLSCPTGGQFHICTSTTVPFLGCCTVDPCTATRDGACPLDNLRSSSFNPDTHEDLPRQDCDDAKSIEIWYTCKFNNPPFVGCCASNACGAGLCAPTDLRPAKLSGDEKLRGLFLNPTTTAVPSASVSGTSVVTSPTGSVVPAPPVPVVEPKAGGLPTGAIVGIVIGVLALAALVFGAYKFGGARKKKGRGVPEGAQDQQTGSRDYGQQDGGQGDKSAAHGLGIQSQYRDSTFSGSTAFSPPMTQHAAFATPQDAKSLAVSSPGFGPNPSTARHSFVSDVYTTTGSPYGSNFPTPYQQPQHLQHPEHPQHPQHSQHSQHPQYPQYPGVPAVELPVEAPSAHELPVEAPSAQELPAGKVGSSNMGDGLDRAR